MCVPVIRTHGRRISASYHLYLELRVRGALSSPLLLQRRHGRCQGQGTYIYIYIYVYMRVCRRMGPYIRTTSMELYMGSVTGRSTASVRVDDIIARIDRLMEASGMLEHIHILHVRALHIRMDEADAWCRCAWIHPSHRS